MDQSLPSRVKSLACAGRLPSSSRPGYSHCEPTAAEVIEALQASGDHTGLGAFNPPGTSPPLQGLAVPLSVRQYKQAASR